MPEVVVEIHEEAIAEARAAREWYESRSQGAADAFFEELDQAVERIAVFSEAWPPYLANTRRCPLRRFPFSVVYRKRKDRVQIVAVAHNSRKPGYWKGRLRT